MTFRTLQDAAETNPAQLNSRLKDLRAVDLVAHEGDGYFLTEQGLGLLEALNPLTQWAANWGAQLLKNGQQPLSE